MSYQQYYEQDPSQQQEEQQPQKSSRKGLWITLIGVTAVLAILILLVVGFVRSLGTKLELEGILPEDSVLENILQETPDPTPKPQPTPLPTERPMADLDGEAPFILELANPIPEIAEAVGASVVGVENYILTKQGKPVLQGEGSGFIVSTDGYILTNYHVVEDSNSISVSLYDGRTLDAKLVGYDESNDIAVLKVEAENLQPVIIGDSSNLNVGDSVIAIGNPLGELTFSLTSGVVSALAREVTFSGGITMSLIQTDCAINSGNSGGALFNLYGEVIGITNAKYSGSSGGSASIDNIGFAIPMNRIRSIVDSIIENGFVIKPYIGVSIVDVSAETQSYGLPQGAAIRSIEADSPAQECGLQVNDIITHVNGEVITGSSDLKMRVTESEPGDELQLTVWRKGTTIDLTLTVGQQIQAGTTTQQQTQQPNIKPFYNWE